MKTVKFRIQPSWFDSEIFETSKIKHNFRKIYKETGLEQYKENFERYKVELKIQVLEEKSDFILSDPCSSENKSDNQVNKKFQSFINSGTQEQNAIVFLKQQVHYKGRYRSETQDQSKASDYNIPVNFKNSLTLEEFSPIEVYNYLKNIKTSKAPGPDAISGQVLKNCAGSLSYPLTTQYISYQQGQLPISKLEKCKCCTNSQKRLKG